MTFVRKAHDSRGWGAGSERSAPARGDESDNQSVGHRPTDHCSRSKHPHLRVFLGANVSSTSAIEWTDATWNPVTGCTKISPGCAHCYIERTPAFRIAGRRFVKGAIPVLLHPARLGGPLRWRKPRRVFVCSLADLFHEDVPDAFIDRVFGGMLAAKRN